MRNLAPAILLFVLASPALAATYHLSPTGSDTNNGTSSSAPWLTPNHAVTCGDVIIASEGAYQATNFSSGKWGTVTCVGNNNVAWLKCATFDGCKISGLTNLQNGMEITKSYWGVQGWEVDGTSAAGMCFFTGWANIRNIIFANNIAVGCGLSGFEAGNNGLAGPDYIAFVGNIAYGNSGNITQGCGSGIIVYEPVAQDLLVGTHIYAGGNFSWSNVDGNPCGASTPTDGEGLIFDTFDGDQTSGLSPYTQQAVADNNILIQNGGRGMQVNGNTSGSQNAPIYVRQNTVWGNNFDMNQANQCACALGEILLLTVNNVQVFRNIAVTNSATGARSNPIYAYMAGTTNGTDHVYQDVGYAATGSNSDSINSTGFSYGPSNLLGINPNFANAVAPGAPNCSGFASVPACMAQVIANFTPTNPVAVSYGYQVPSAVPTYDPLFPQWLCNVNLPPGLVTMGCLAQSSVPATPTITIVKVQ